MLASDAATDDRACQYWNLTSPANPLDVGSGQPSRPGQRPALHGVRAAAGLEVGLALLTGV